MTSLIKGEKMQSHRFFWYFLVVWIVYGLFQLYYTDMNGEEAYYWLFSQNLDWGYLDHPPMIGIITAPGYWLFPNNLGVRLAMLVCNVVTILFIRKTLSVKDDNLYLWILAGMLPMHAGSLFLKTDVPLVMFEVMFFYFYKQYLKVDDLKNSILIALSIVLMLMSKHHGILVVLFTVISNTKLLTKKSFWIIVGLTVLLMLPYTYWQYQNEFATIKFHLRNRIDLGFKIKNILYYVFFQPIFFAPFTGIILFAACYKNKIKSDFSRALKFTLVGVLLFFLVSTFKVEFHKHWTSILAVPLIILSHEYISQYKKTRFWVIRLSQVSAFIGILGGVYLMFDFLPKSLTKDWDKLHNWDKWGEEIKTLSGGLPIIFINHYENASRYSYITKDPALSYNTFRYRETQHDFWPIEDSLQGKKVFIIDRHNRDKIFPTYMTEIGEKVYYRVEDNFRSFRKVKVELNDASDITASVGQVVIMDIDLMNNYEYIADFADVNERKVYLQAHFLKETRPILESNLDTLNFSIQPGATITKTVSVKVPSEPGEYDLRFSIKIEGIEAPINSRKYSVEVH